jgi:hypothetical protein
MSKACPPLDESDDDSNLPPLDVDYEEMMYPPINAEGGGIALA